MNTVIARAIADLDASAALLTRAADALAPTHPVSADASRDSAAELHLRALRLRLTLGAEHRASA
jgi:hypothetical protein